VTVLIIVAAIAVAIMAIAVIGARWGRPRPLPVDPSWSWEGIRLAPAQLEPPSTEATDRGNRPRLMLRGEYMARPSIYREAVSDWEFSSEATPIVVLFDVSRGVEIHRASLDRIRGEYRAVVQGLSISYAMPSPRLPVSDDGGRREGAPFAVDIGFYVEPRDEPWELRVHAELGPLRSDPITIAVPAREST
jgi:hypothetical protein